MTTIPDSRHRARRIWRNMKYRCGTSTAPNWSLYGGRGIKVCNRWQHSFENFWADMGESYKDGLSLDRVDNNRGYEPGNCAWRTPRQQCNNRRNNRMLRLATGEEITAAEASRRSGLKLKTILGRLDAGYSPDLAIDKPLRSSERGIVAGPDGPTTIRQAAENAGITVKALQQRIRKGRSLSEALQVHSRPKSI